MWHRSILDNRQEHAKDTKRVPARLGPLRQGLMVPKVFRVTGLVRTTPVFGFLESFFCCGGTCAKRSKTMISYYGLPLVLLFTSKFTRICFIICCSQEFTACLQPKRQHNIQRFSRPLGHPIWVPREHAALLEDAAFWQTILPKGVNQTEFKYALKLQQNSL